MMKSRRMRWTGHVARRVEKRNACRVLAGKSDVKRQLWWARHGWEYNSKRDIRELGWGDGLD
jgi:hypothetical protein